MLGHIVCDATCGDGLSGNGSNKGKPQKKSKEVHLDEDGAGENDNVYESIWLVRL